MQSLMTVSTPPLAMGSPKGWAAARASGPGASCLGLSLFQTHYSGPAVEPSRLFSWHLPSQKTLPGLSSLHILHLHRHGGHCAPGVQLSSETWKN